MVSDLSKRTRILTAPFDVTVKPLFKFNQVTMQKEFIDFEATTPDLVDYVIWNSDALSLTDQHLWNNQLEPQFQYVLPYVFLSEEKIDMNIIGLQPTETKSKISNLKFIEAVLPISTMARSLSSAWAFMDEEEAHFIKNEPIMKLIFSKPVDLHYFTAGPLFNSWAKVNSQMVDFQRRATVRKFKNITNRMPKKLFQEIKNNIEYGEA